MGVKLTVFAEGQFFVRITTIKCSFCLEICLNKGEIHNLDFKAYVLHRKSAFELHFVL
jgi:hypothetical protein